MFDKVVLSQKHCLQVSLEQAIQALITLQQLPNQTEPTSPATPLHIQQQPDAATQAATQIASTALTSVPAAAKQMLQTLAAQHSTRHHAIFDACHVEQLLQPCLRAFCQSETAASKGSTACSVGTTASANGQRLPPVACSSYEVHTVAAGVNALSTHDNMTFR